MALEGSDFLPQISKCVHSESGTTLAAWNPDTPLESLLDLYTPTTSGVDVLLETQQISNLDTLFECLPDKAWAFYTATSGRREALLAAVRSCPGAVIAEDLVLRPRRSHFA